MKIVRHKNHFHEFTFIYVLHKYNFFLLKTNYPEELFQFVKLRFNLFSYFLKLNEKKSGGPDLDLEELRVSSETGLIGFFMGRIVFLMIECKGKPADEYRQLSNLRPS